MTVERIDIEVVDKIDPALPAKITALATAARQADVAFGRLSAQFKNIDIGGLERLAAANATMATAQSKLASSQARIVTANARLTESNNRTAESQAKVAAINEKAAATAAKAAAQVEAVTAQSAAKVSKINADAAKSAIASNEAQLTAAVARDAKMVESRARADAIIAASSAKAEAITEKAAAASFEAQSRIQVAQERAAAIADKSASAMVLAEQKIQTERERTAAQAATTLAAEAKLETAYKRLEIATTNAGKAAEQAAFSTLKQEHQLDMMVGSAHSAASGLDHVNSAQERLNGTIATATGLSRLQQQQNANLFYQLNDIVVSLVSGQAPLTVFVQQGSQILTIWGAEGGGVRGLIKNLTTSLWAMAAPFLPLIIAVGALGAGFLALHETLDDGSGVQYTYGDTFNAVIGVIGKAFRSLFGDTTKLSSAISSSFSSIVSALKWVTNKLIGGFVFAYKAIVLVFTGLPDSLHGLVAAAVNLMVDALETFMNFFVDMQNKVIAGTNNMLARMGTSMSIALTPKVDFSGFKVQGSAAADAFVGKFKQTATESFSTDYLGMAKTAIQEERVKVRDKRILDKRDEVAKKKLAKKGGEFTSQEMAAAKAAAAAGKDKPIVEGVLNADGEEIVDAPPPPPPLTGGLGGGGVRGLSGGRGGRSATGRLASASRATAKKKVANDNTATARERAPTYADVKTKVQNDIAELQQVGAARRTLTIILDAQEKLHRKLTDSEKAELTQLAKQLDVAKIRADMLDNATKSLDDYNNTVTAGTQLLKENLITQEQYNATLAKTQVKSDLRSVDSALPAYKDAAANEQAKITQQERISIVQQAVNAKVITEQEGADRILAINRQLAADLRDTEVAKNSAMLTSASDAFDSMASATAKFAGEQSGIYKVMFATSKAFAIADSIIKIQQGIANATALPFPQNLAAMGTVAAAASSIVSSIEAVYMGNGKKDGGYITGPGGPRDDRVPIMASNGEFVINAEATRRNRPLLEAINSNNTGAYRDGGMVGRPRQTQAMPKSAVGNKPVEQNQRGNVTVNVYTNDANSFMASKNQVSAALARAVNSGYRNL